MSKRGEKTFSQQQVGGWKVCISQTEMGGGGGRRRCCGAPDFSGNFLLSSVSPNSTASRRCVLECTCGGVSSGWCRLFVHTGGTEKKKRRARPLIDGPTLIRECGHKRILVSPPAARLRLRPRDKFVCREQTSVSRV